MSKWITYSGSALLLVLIAMAAIWLWANLRYRGLMMEARLAWSDIATNPTNAPEAFTKDMILDLPEIAQRFFEQAIAEGTPLYNSVELDMAGTFIMGQANNPQEYDLRARQILAPPDEFVWIASMSSGLLTFSGSDGLQGGHGWTRFWMYRALPLVQVAATANIDRSAAARPAIEAIWAPATLLPANGVRWEQIGPDLATATFVNQTLPITITLRIDADGALQEVWTERWSDENPEKEFRLQPFGAFIEDSKTFDGFTIPSRVSVGNHFGTEDFFPFFKVELTKVRHF